MVETAKRTTSPIINTSMKVLPLVDLNILLYILLLILYFLFKFFILVSNNPKSILIHPNIYLSKYLTSFYNLFLKVTVVLRSIVLKLPVPLWSTLIHNSIIFILLRFISFTGVTNPPSGNPVS